MASHPTITLGSSGAAVTLAQKQLVARGNGPLATDGIFGAQTDNALRTYQDQRSNDAFLPLVMDGILGPRTWARLDPATIKKGAKGEIVKLLQDRLNGFSVAIGAVAVDGVFGPGTETAVKAFQTFWGTLTVDGVVGPLTWTAVWS